MQAEGIVVHESFSHRDFVVARILGSCNRFCWWPFLASSRFSWQSWPREEAFPATSSTLKRLPAWVASRSTGDELQHRIYEDTGVFPLIAGSLLSDNVVHRFGAIALDRIAGLADPARGRPCCFGLGLVCIVLIALVAVWRRRVMANAATEVAASLRRQIHRQMYRLGQSSLPTEG